MTARPHRRTAFLAAASSLAVTLAAGTAHAAEPVAADVVVGELVVTAERREQALQEVPIAVSAFTQARLEAQRLDTGPELIKALPNVTFAQSYFSGFNFQIRGVGTQLGTASADAGVGIHLNNVPLTASRFFEAEFFDVTQVEVLRGPQGTLYGRNATGGVVNVFTAKPTRDFGGAVTLEAGSYRSFKAKGDLNVPLGEALALRLAASYLRRDGFGENTFTGKDVNGRDLYSTRATLAFEPNDRLNATLMWQHFEEIDDRLRSGGVLCTKDPGPSSVGGVAVTDPIARGLLSQGCANASLYTRQAHGTPNSLGTLFGILPQLFGVTNGDYNAGKLLSADLNDTNSFFEPRYKARNDIVQLSVDYDLTPGLKLSSLTGYAEDKLDNFADFFGFVPSVGFSATPFTPGGVFTDPQLGALSRSASTDRLLQRSKQFTQEIRLQSDFSGPANFALGANYLNFDSTLTVTIPANVFTLTSLVLNGGAPCALGNPACIYIDPSPAGGTLGHNYYVNQTPYELTSKAVFGELYYRLAEDLKLTLGARYTHDHKLQDNIPVPLLAPGSGLAAGTPPRLTSDFKQLTGRAGVDWLLHPGFADKTLLYGFYSRGYKAGGSNAPAAVGVGSVKASYDPEFVNAFEVGAKNTFQGGRLTANLTGFYYDYSGYQVAEIVSETQVVQNVDARVRGLEFELAWQATPAFELDATAGLMRSRIRNSTAIDPANITNGNPALTLVKTSTGGNCAASTAALGNLLAIIQQRPGAPNIPGVSGNPTALLGVCAGAFAGLGVTRSEGEATQLTGKELPNAPSWTLSLGAQYRWELPQAWSATLRGDLYVQDAAYARIYNTTQDRLKRWSNVNATLTFRNPNGWQGQLFVKNLFDKQPIINTFLYDAITGLYTQGFTNEPRIAGANLTKSF